MKLYLAPLHGVTGRVFRAAWMRHFTGFDAVYAPFVVASPGTSGKASILRDLESLSVPLIPQILGNDGDSFIAVAALAAELDYPEVNWNLGCPHPVVAKKNRGSGLLAHTERIERLLDSIVPCLTLPLSVKLRLGYSDPSDLLRLMPILNHYPLAKVIIHPRIGTQLYRGTVDLEGFAEALSLCSHQVVYNGDIRSAAFFRELGERFPSVSEWMIGRAALSDPFLPAVLKGLSVPASPEERSRAVRAFLDDLCASYREVLFGPAHVLDKMKEVWSYIGPSFSGADRALLEITRVKTLEGYAAAEAAVFASGSWRM